MSVFEEFTEFDIETRFPVTDDIVTEEEIQKLAKRLGDEHITDIDGELVHNPQIRQQPPPLTRQPSIGETFVRTLYIDPIDIDSLTSKDRATKSISIINNYLSKSGIFWNITFETIKEKLRKNGNYLGNTLYGIWRLADGANLVMSKSLIKNEDNADSVSVIIDYSNLQLGLERECKPSKPAGVSLADEINDWTIETFGRCDRIIISIQAHYIPEPNFKMFKNRLKEIFGSQNIVIIVGSNASSYDDLNIAYIVTQLLPKSKKYIISSDKFRDLHRINTDGITTSPIFVNSEQLQMITVDTFCKPSYKYTGSAIEPYRRIRDTRAQRRTTPYGRRGGTNKNKKLLLNKYNKKIKYTRKLKKLHKKRIPTKKVVKKYSKNCNKKTLKKKK
jgi:hypothetical protein